MPLSEHEQRLLAEIEQALYAEDPKFVSAVRSVRTRSRTRRSIVLCVLGVIAGLGLVLVGLISTLVVLSIIGFVMVVGACGLGVQAVRTRHTSSSGGGSGSVAAPRGSGGLRSRMEERLRRRFDES